LLDRVIVLNERHLKRLMAEYVRYYHEDRTHLGLAKDTPAGRPIAIRSAVGSKIQSFPRLGGLHHRYAVAAQIDNSALPPLTSVDYQPRSVRIWFMGLGSTSIIRQISGTPKVGALLAIQVAF
jgi:hypothetical protein